MIYTHGYKIGGERPCTLPTICKKPKRQQPEKDQAELQRIVTRSPEKDQVSLRHMHRKKPERDQVSKNIIHSSTS
jgi:hypothetical protein